MPTEEGVKHEVYLFNFSPRHRWFYFPGMDKDEALLIKCFDSLNDGRARVTAHSAFDDPSTPANPRPRRASRCERWRSLPSNVDDAGAGTWCDVQ